jgi:acyl-CoA dehydrogenase
MLIIDNLALERRLMQSSTTDTDFDSVLQRVKTIAQGVAAAHADQVDREARFPQETVDALKEARLMSAPLPKPLGGMGLNLTQQAQLCASLGTACGASAMVLAMHYSQLACLGRHTAGKPEIEQYLRELSDHQYLLASMTSEQGTFGNTRTSICAVQVEGGTYRLDKDATTGSYCAHADAILITCRKNDQAAESDQALVLAKKGQYTLTQTSNWDTLGMRGTCSPGFKISAQGPAWQVLPCPFAECSAESMVPFSHVIWAALWSGIAAGAVMRAAGFVRSAARKTPGKTPPTAQALAGVAAQLQAMRQQWQTIGREFDALSEGEEQRTAMHTMAWALKFNNLKVSASSAAPQIVHQALQIVGIMGYKNDGPYSLGRHYRDVLSASLMISNERILSKNADMLLVLKEF